MPSGVIEVPPDVVVNVVDGNVIDDEDEDEDEDDISPLLLHLGLIDFD